MLTHLLRALRLGPRAGGKSPLPDPAQPSSGAAEARALFDAAQAASRRGETAAAVTLMQRAAALDPESPAIRYDLGNLGLRGGDLAAAERGFREALALHPRYPLALDARIGIALARARSDLARGAQPRLLPPPAAPTPRISIIICSVLPEKFAAVCASFRSRLAGLDFEIIGIHDAKSLCEGYNRGVSKARGDVLVFSHDDIEIVSPDFAARLLRHLQSFDLLGVAGTTRLVDAGWTSAGWPHVHGHIARRDSPENYSCYVVGIHAETVAQVRAVDGVLFAIRRRVLDKVRFDEASFDGWHMYDIDFSFAAYLAGFSLAVCNDIVLLHASGGDFGEAWQRAAERFRQKYAGRLDAQAAGTPIERLGAGFRSEQELLLFSEHMRAGDVIA